MRAKFNNIANRDTVKELTSKFFSNHSKLLLSLHFHTRGPEFDPWSGQFLLRAGARVNIPALSCKDFIRSTRHVLRSEVSKWNSLSVGLALREEERAPATRQSRRTITLEKKRDCVISSGFVPPCLRVCVSDW